MEGKSANPETQTTWFCGLIYERICREVFPPDLHGEGKKKKKKKLNVLGDQTTSYSLCLEAARAA